MLVSWTGLFFADTGMLQCSVGACTSRVGSRGVGGPADQFLGVWFFCALGGALFRTSDCIPLVSVLSVRPCRIGGHTYLHATILFDNEDRLAFKRDEKKWLGTFQALQGNG